MNLSSLSKTLLVTIYISTLIVFNYFPTFSQDTQKYIQITKHENQKILIGELGKPLGTTLTVQGIIVSISSKGYRNGLNFLVQSINDSAIQDKITIQVLPYFGNFGDKQIPKLQINSTYRLRVYETGSFEGIPEEAYNEAGRVIQESGFHFLTKLMVISGKQIPVTKETPNNFVGQVALISGIAKNENDTPFINTYNSKIRILGFRKWTTAEIGKSVEVYGKIEQTEDKQIYNVRDCIPRLTKLEDQLGMTVKLRGKAITTNNFWWFNYRGIDVYVEKMEELPNWTTDNHFRPMEISGVLEQAILPRLDQIGLKEKRDKKLYFIIRNAKWKPIEKLLSIEDPDNN